MRWQRRATVFNTVSKRLIYGHIVRNFTEKINSNWCQWETNQPAGNYEHAREQPHLTGALFPRYSLWS